MSKKYQVFISSTYEDLKDERNAVTESLLDMGCCFPAGMERFPASSLSQWEYIKKIIDESDYYLLIVAGRYGSLDADEKISYTEKEYNYAENKNIPILTFVHENIDNLPAKFVDKRRTQINSFRKKVSAGRLVKYYSSADDLRSKVKDTLYSEIQVTPRPGWIRADEVEAILDSDDNAQKFEILQNNILKKVEESAPKWKLTTKEDIDAMFDDSKPLISALSNEAKKLLIEAVKDSEGRFQVFEIDNATCIRANGVTLNKEWSGREVAIWKEAVNELVRNKLATSAGGSKEMFNITAKGYELAEQLSS